MTPPSGWRERRRRRTIDRVQAARQTLATMSPWARRGVYVAGGVLFAAGLGMSGYFLAQLAESFGIASPFSYLLPAALDAGAMVGVFMWVTGTGEIEMFGKVLARQMFALSIIGNGLERALTFVPAPAPAVGTSGAGTALLQRTVAVITLLTTGGVVEIVAGWGLLLVSIGIGIVFPVLAYRMGHAIILARKTADSTSREHSQRQRFRDLIDFVAALAGLFRRPAPVPAPAAEPAPTTETREPEPDVQDGIDTGPLPTAPTAEPAATPRPYVHDPRDLDPGTPEWMARFASLPGTTKGAKLEVWLEHEWNAGREPKLTPVADRVVDGNRTAQNAKRSLVDRGVLPPSQRIAPGLAPVG